MNEFIKNILFGLAFGVGFSLAAALIHLLVSFLSHAH